MQRIKKKQRKDESIASKTLDVPLKKRIAVKDCEKGERGHQKDGRDVRTARSNDTTEERDQPPPPSMRQSAKESKAPKNTVRGYCVTKKPAALAEATPASRTQTGPTDLSVHIPKKSWRREYAAGPPPQASCWQDRRVNSAPHNRRQDRGYSHRSPSSASGSATGSWYPSQSHRQILTKGMTPMPMMSRKPSRPLSRWGRR